MLSFERGCSKEGKEHATSPGGVKGNSTSPLLDQDSWCFLYDEGQIMNPDEYTILMISLEAS